MTVYGTFSSAVETALDDGWLSCLDMSTLRRPGGRHSDMYDGAGHDVMEILIQRYLPYPVKNANFSETERLTWEGGNGTNGVRNLGALDRQNGVGSQVSRYEHYIWQKPDFQIKANPTDASGPILHQFNMSRYINQINSETTIAPDDKACLIRLEKLRYVMRYPTNDDRPMPGGVPGLPEPTKTQIDQYKLLEPQRFEISGYRMGLDQLAISMYL